MVPSYLKEVWTLQASFKSATHRKALRGWALWMGVCGNQEGVVSCVSHYGAWPGDRPLEKVNSSWMKGLGTTPQHSTGSLPLNSILWKSYFPRVSWPCSYLPDMEHAWVLGKTQAGFQLQALLSSAWSLRSPLTPLCPSSPCPWEKAEHRAQNTVRTE